MAKIVKFVLIAVLILILTAAFFRQALCRCLIETAVAGACGLKLSIEHLDLDILRNKLHLQGITLLNPPGFKDESLAKAKEILIKYEPLDLLRGRVHLPLLKVNISEVNIIRSENNASNVVNFKKMRSGAKPKAQHKQTQTPSNLQEVKQDIPPQPKLLIDRLELSLEKVTFINYQAGVGEPAVIIFTVDGPCVFKNVTDLNYVINSVSVKGGFKNILNGIIARITPDALKNTTETIKQRIEGLIPKPK